MTNCDQVPLIEFLKAELDANETEEVLRHVENCDNCRERVQVMAAIAASYPEREVEKPHRKSSRNLWLIAAGIMAALLAPVLYMQMSSAEIGRLATSEKYPASFPLVTRGGVELSVGEQVRQDAFEAYRKGDFELSAALFRLLPPQADNLFYLGVSQYLSGDPDQALDSLKRAADLDRKWDQPACWYRASAYLKTGQKKEAQEALRKLLKGDGEYRKKAEELLGKLE